MARKKKTVEETVVNSVVEESNDASTPEAEPQEPRPVLASLKRDYAEADERAKEYREMALGAEIERSHALQAISHHYGNGPYAFGGKTVTITSREKKDIIDPSTGEPYVAFFFKRLGGQEVIDLD